MNKDIETIRKATTIRTIKVLSDMAASDYAFSHEQREKGHFNTAKFYAVCGEETSRAARLELFRLIGAEPE